MTFTKNKLTDIIGEKITKVSPERTIQQLWAGYGSVKEFTASVRDAQDKTYFVVKRVNPPSDDTGSVSHARKIRSYHVEAHFYEFLVPMLNEMWAALSEESTLTSPEVPQPYFIQCDNDSDDKEAGNQSFTFLLSDLRREYIHSSGYTLSLLETRAALRFLAGLHSTFWERADILQSTSTCSANNKNVWECGGYWHLETRLDELECMPSEWDHLKRAAYAIDSRMKNKSGRCKHQTLCHGDFKSANLLFSSSNAKEYECATVDFQYTGGGYGLKDVVMLFVSSVQTRLLSGNGERDLLQFYFDTLCQNLDHLGIDKSGYTVEDVMIQYELCLVDYVRFMAGWGFWGASSSYAERRVSSIMKEMCNDVGNIEIFSEKEWDAIVIKRFPL